MKKANLQEYFDNIYSNDLNLLKISVIDLEKDIKHEESLLSCMGRRIDLNERKTIRKPIKWFLREVSEYFYKCKLGHCDSACLCKRSRSGENAYWRFFDISEHPDYRQLEMNLRRELFHKQTGIILQGNGYKQIIEFSRTEGNDDILKDINERIAEYLIDQLLVDYAHQVTNKFQDQKYSLSLDEYNELIAIAEKRHKRKQPLSYELQSFLVEKIQGKTLKGSDSTKPRIGKSVDYRIIYMIKEKAEAEGKDYRKLETRDKIITDICDEIYGWGYFKKVGPISEGKVKKDCSIKAVRERYCAKHPA